MSVDRVIFFDGICGLCDKYVTFMVDADKGNRLKFATQQGATFQHLSIREKAGSSSDTIFYLKDGKVTAKSTAVLQAMSDLGGAWKLVGLLRIIPRFVRDFIYDRIAVNRYSIFGKMDACRLPTPEERAKFLD